MGCAFNADLVMQKKAVRDVYGWTRDFIRRVRRDTNCRTPEMSKLA
jgi:hypothetical protein